MPPLQPAAWQVVDALPLESDLALVGLKLPQLALKSTLTGVVVAGLPLTATSTLTVVFW